MDEEKQSLLSNQAPPPTVGPNAPPPAYSAGQPGHLPPQYVQGPGGPGYVQGPQGYAQQQQRQVTVITAVPVQREVWRSPRGDILPQPDPNRVVIGGTARYRYGMLMSNSYTYADQLPCLTSSMLMFIVLCFFIGTPLSLLCSIPAYYFVNKVRAHTHTCTPEEV